MNEFKDIHERKEASLANWKYRVKIKKMENLHHERLVEEFMKVEIELKNQKRVLMQKQDGEKEKRIR